eukprot:CAMPEP_0119472906 /NCGR_PEP_ID=MMETSP1344-20130328/4780_1 /TAXON_ID=236787 /ORGANISM="Florenciella parvula, Strain CCMP2471" /LENGTH=390 /DNA_ID=CAMNT_0007505943 /DNA_START=114 /DNA_END=1286 /DNA_ORIENTATION=-
MSVVPSPEALDNSLLKALAEQVEAILTGKANTPATLRAAAAAATDVAAMLQASALDLDLDADRERAAAVARVEPAPAPASQIGLSAAALRQVMLYSSTDTIANATLVSKEMRYAFFMCKDELVTNLLHQRSPHMAQVMKLVAKKGRCGCTGDITALYRRTVEVETQKCGLGTQPTPPPAIEFNEVIVSFELVTDIDAPQDHFELLRATATHDLVGNPRNPKVGRWAAALGPMFTEDGGFKMSVPEDVLQTIGLPTVSDRDLTESVIPDDMYIRVKIFISAVYNNELRSNIVYKGGPDDYRFDDVGDSVCEHLSYDSLYFEGCGCSRGNSERGWNQFTEVLLTCEREKRDNGKVVRYEVRCQFNECHEDGGFVDSVGHSRASTWIRHLVVS